MYVLETFKKIRKLIKMNFISSLAPEILLVLAICLQIHEIIGVNGNYNTCSGVVSDKLNVHLVAHTHDDVGWLKTIDQYFIGSNTTIQEACVENVLDSLVNSLLRDPNRKFVYAEMAFFNRWWQIQSTKIREQVKELVVSGQLEFVNGGWCMHDEAATHYIDMIDQTTLGHDLIKKLFNVTPRAGWQIDPFGHSAVQAYLLGAELGFDSVHFARIDYQDREQRKNNKTLEVVWRGSKTFGSTNQIFANAFPVHYYPPVGFEFEISNDYVPVQDNPLLFDYNVNTRVEDFVTAAQNQANVTRTNHIMWTMGSDFGYQYAESWFKEMDKLIHHVNQDGRVNAVYSTPSIYTDAKNAANESWPLKTGDYFPYAEGPNAYWTGYFTSRPSLKRYVRFLSGYYQAARQLEFLVGRNNNTGRNTYSLGDALGIAQHHDAVSGTARQHTTDDYSKRLAIGASQAETVVNLALSYLVTSNSRSRPPLVSATTLSQCGLLNISYCPSTEQHIPNGKNTVVVAYNPLGWERTDIIRIPVNDSDLVVRDSVGTKVESQYIELDEVTISLRKFHVKAYIGIEPQITPKYWLVFPVSVPPLGWNTYFISKTSQKRIEISTMDVVTSTSPPDKGTVVIGQGNFTLSFSKASGQLIHMSNSATRVDMPVQQEYLWYASSAGNFDDAQASGAYVFRPDQSPTTVVRKSVPLKVIRGKLVDEIHQQFNSWIYQVFRVYKGKDHAEVEFTIGPIPTDDGIGKEVITQITANMSTNKVFYTDSNGRDFLKRVRDHRSDWPLHVTQPVAGNYYPLNLGIYTADEHSELSVLVDRATGGSSIKDGQIEVMFHRSMLNDDGKGVGESLDEIVCVGDNNCQGLTIRGSYYINVNKLGAGSRWRRTTGQEIYSPLIIAFTQENSENWKSSHVSKSTTMASGYTLPPNVALITLQELSDGNVLLRLAHLYEANEDLEYSNMARVELQKLFAGKTIKTIKETSLSANQEISQMKRLDWKVYDNDDFDNDYDNDSKPIRGGPVDSSNFIVNLGPMEIRTFLLSF